MDPKLEKGKMQLVTIEAMKMPNDEIIHSGRTVGWVGENKAGQKDLHVEEQYIKVIKTYE